MLELFRVEAETQTVVLTGGLLELERGAAEPQQFETLMRAAHSLKGAARIVNLQVAVRVAHAMEDCFVAAQRGTLQLHKAEIDLLFRGVDLLQLISKRSEADIGSWEKDHATEINEFLAALARLMSGESPVANVPTSAAAAPKTAARETSRSEKPVVTSRALPAPTAKQEPEVIQAEPISPRKHEPPERVLRLTAENLNRLLALAGESLVESRWLRPFAVSLERLKRQQAELSQRI